MAMKRVACACGLLAVANAFLGPPALTTRSVRSTTVMVATSSGVSAETAEDLYVLDGKAIGGPLLPLSNCILIKVADKRGVTSGGIVLSAKSQERPNEGVVIAMGPGKLHPETARKIPMPCAVGDRVLYGKFDGCKVNYQRKDHQFIRDDDVLFVYGGDEMTVDSIKMIRDQILVKLSDDEDKTAGGLVLAAAEDDGPSRKPSTGEVVAVGPGATTPEGEYIPMTLVPGDLIKFQNFAGTELELQGTMFRVMRQGEVLVKW